MADAASGSFPELADALEIISVDAVGDALTAAINAAVKGSARRSCTIQAAPAASAAQDRLA